MSHRECQIVHPEICGPCNLDSGQPKALPAAVGGAHRKTRRTAAEVTGRYRKAQVAVAKARGAVAHPGARTASSSTSKTVYSTSWVAQNRGRNWFFQYAAPESSASSAVVGSAWSETQTWDISKRVATAAGVPDWSLGPHRRAAASGRPGCRARVVRACLPAHLRRAAR